MAKEIKNIGASVRARLLHFAKTSGQSFDLVLTRFALERLLFRLGESPHANRSAVQRPLTFLLCDKADIPTLLPQPVFSAAWFLNDQGRRVRFPSRA